ncbi:MAG: glycosyltransferase family protein [Pseudomonadota bacterium]
MRILYGVQTTGRGHVVRARGMIAALKANGHDVKTVFSGAKLDTTWFEPTFEPYLVFDGLTHRSHAGQFRTVSTAYDAITKMPRLARDILRLDAADLDVVVTDYEPITAYFARLRGVPSIGVGHLYAFAHEVPVAPGRLIDHAVMRGFAPASIPLGMHWDPFGQAILPPTIPPDIRAIADQEIPEEDDFVVVYMGFEDTDRVAAMVAGFPDRRFRVYCKTDAPREIGNVQFVPQGRAPFVADLARASAIICNTGFSLISEALYLGKRILTKPLTGNVEQEANAVALKQLGLARVMTDLSSEAVGRLVEDASPEPIRYPDVMTALVEWIGAGDWSEPERLAESLWSNTSTSRKRDPPSGVDRKAS